jgi:cell division protein FtsQ
MSSRPARTRPERSGRPARRPVRSRPSRPRAEIVPTRRRVLARRWIAVSVAVGVVLVAAAVWWTPLLGVRSVDVSGTRQLTADQVRTAASVPDGTPMVRLNLRSVQARVALLPRVASVRVAREWPSTVRIQITERSPIGYLVESDGTHLVDATGRDYATVTAPPHGLPKIVLTAVSPADQRTEAVVGVLRALPAQLRSLVLTVSARTPGSVTLGLTHGRTVRWGSAADSTHKAEVLAPLMTRLGKVYDVSSPELPTVS